MVGPQVNNEFILLVPLFVSYLINVEITYKGIWYILIYHDLRYLLNAIHITIYREKEKEKQIYIFNKNILHIIV